MKYSIKDQRLPKKVSILDLDGTILNTSILMEHYVYLINNDIVTPCKEIKLWLNDKKNDELITKVADNYKTKVMRLRNSVIEETAKAVVESLPEDKYNVQVLELIAKDIKNSVLPIIISGSPKYLVKAIARRISVIASGKEGKVKGYGSLYEETGIVPMWKAENKQEFIAKYLTDVFVFRGIGDTFADIPLLEVAKQKILVNPNDMALQKANEKGLKFRIILGN
jgi:phosphoserine phosphatase